MLLQHIITFYKDQDPVRIRSSETPLTHVNLGPDSKRVNQKEDLNQFDETQLIQIYNHLTNGASIRKTYPDTIDKIWGMMTKPEFSADGWYDSLSDSVEQKAEPKNNLEDFF